MPRLAILICLVHLILTLTLEGAWVLEQIHDSSISLPVKISYYVYRNQSVMGKLQIEGCELLSYQFNLEDDNIYIDTDNELFRPLRNCTQT